MNHFTVTKRNPGHWDIYSSEARLFRIRGNPGKFHAMDERAKPYPTTTFKTLSLCMAFIAEELMHEDIIADPCGDGNNIPRP